MTVRRAASTNRKWAIAALPRLAPIEEIDAPTDLTRLKRKEPFTEIPGYQKGHRKGHRSAQSSGHMLRSDASSPDARRRTRLALFVLVFLAGCLLGVSVIFLMR